MCIRDSAIVEEQAEGTLPVAETEPVASEVIYDAGVVAGGIITDGQPIQAFDSSSCCNSCCEESSFVQPVVFNQPIISSQPIVPEIAPIQATFDSQPIANLAPAPVETFAPVATSIPAPTVTQAFTSAPAPTQTFVWAPVASAGCSACGVQAAAPVACGNCDCQTSRRFLQRGLFSRLRGAAISSAINDN